MEVASHTLSARAAGIYRRRSAGYPLFAGLAALQNDPETKVIVIVSKPPDEAVASRVIEQASKLASLR